MAARSNKSAAPAGTLDLTLVRVFDAPVSLLFRCWTEPEHLKRWSAPRGFTLPSVTGELRPGGAWRSCMVAPDGKQLWLGGIYREIVKDRLLVFTHAWDNKDGSPGHETVVTVRFQDQGGKTQLTFHQAPFENPGSRDGHQGGWGECFERLDGLLHEFH